MLSASVKPEDMDELLAMDYLDELEFTARQIGDDPSWQTVKKRQETGALIDRVRNRLAQCLQQKQKSNLRRWCRSNLSQVRQVKKLAETHPSFVLQGPEDFILYWYVHGGFPCEMSAQDMARTYRKLHSRLNRLISRGGSDSALMSYRREKTKGQLRQLQDMRGAFFRKACGVEAPEDMENAFTRIEEASAYLYYLPDEPEHPEDLTIPELGAEIEKQEYNLLCLKSAENGEEGTEKPVNWQETVDSVNGALDLLRELLKQRLLEALGEESEDPSVPEGFEGGNLSISLGGDALERLEDIVASWYLSDSFPLITSGEKLLQVEAELKRQQSELEAQEPENEAEHGLWQFRWDQRAEQLDQVQAMQLDLVTDWTDEVWDPEEDE